MTPRRIRFTEQTLPDEFGVMYRKGGSTNPRGQVGKCPAGQKTGATPTVGDPGPFTESSCRDAASRKLERDPPTSASANHVGAFATPLDPRRCLH